MSTSVDFQTVIFDRLIADAGVNALVADRIYDRMPANGDYPCVTFGPSDYSPENMECITARSETIQIDCWAQDHGRLRPAKEIVDAVKAALHQFDGVIAQGNLITLNVESVRVFLDSDGIIAHGIVTVTGEIEEG